MSQSFRIARQGAVDLTFDGVLLAEESTRDEPGQTRWTEVRIYRTDTGKYVTETVGRSTRRGETDRITVFVHDSPADVPAGLRRKGRSALTGQDTMFIPNVALDALTTAGKADPALADVLTESI